MTIHRVYASGSHGCICPLVCFFVSLPRTLISLRCVAFIVVFVVVCCRSKMIPVFQIFAGGPLGSGKQWCSWIHRDDLVGMIVSAIEDGSWKGTYNATAPNPVRMGELCAALGQAMGRPSFFPVPDFALKTLLGEGARVVLDGQRVLPAAAQNQGYQFRYSRVQDALRNIMG
jgi:uncharacterized protein